MVYVLKQIAKTRAVGSYGEVTDTWLKQPCAIQLNLEKQPVNPVGIVLSLFQFINIV